MIDNGLPARARVNKNAWHVLAEIGIGDKKDGDDRQGPAHRTPHRFEQNDQQDRAHENVHRERVADAESKFAIDPRDVERRNNAGNSHDPVQHRKPENARLAGGLAGT